MPELPLSGLNYPNIFVRNLLESFEQVAGKEAVHTILAQAGLEQFVENYPPNNMERAVDFADVSAIFAGLETLDHEQPINGNPWVR
jgi:hypothetical protein